MNGRIEIDGGHIAFTEEGSGRPAVLIHGFPLDARMWDDQLVRLGGERHCVAVDLRGHGRSPWAGDRTHAMELFASDIARVIETMAPDGCDVVGLSMGGYVALALAEIYPELVRSLALVDTRSGDDTEEGKTGRRHMADDVVELGRSWVVERMLPVLVAPDADVIVKARLRTMIEDTPTESIVADLLGMADRPDRTAVLGKLAVPVMVIVGEHDALTPPAQSEAMAAAAGTEMVVIPGAGHMSPMERPDEVASALQRLWRNG